MRLGIFFGVDGGLFARRILENGASTVLDFDKVESQERACQEPGEQQRKPFSS